ncbi:RHS repeat domain-containing protein [Rhizobium sp. BK376]|uniref:RHS repeat domain-containing protein n=1 Tax=Rhizobium sp. BK376 TaxID=2512149 RepID=UPI00104F37E9|nr:RHS repeat domain-containing protein [Rhizobium sp. BK376]TCR67889.1 YD repeat-containing protein [Rhizobium sp. BK376]
MIVRFFREVLVLIALFASAFPATADTKSSAHGYDFDGRLTTNLYSDGKCVLYAYDANGNRVSQETIPSDPTVMISNHAGRGDTQKTSSPTQPIWGSGTWGCFSWTAP